MYLRLLNRSVDSLAASSLSAAGGQARFAIPVLLVLLYNRCVAVYSGVLYQGSKAPLSCACSMSNFLCPRSGMRDVWTLTHAVPRLNERRRTTAHGAPALVML